MRTARRPAERDASRVADAALEEVDQRGRRAGRLVLPHEVTGVLEHAQLGIGQLVGEARRHPHRREAVLRTPQDQRGQPERGETPLVWLELREIARAVQLEMALPQLPGRAAL